MSKIGNKPVSIETAKVTIEGQNVSLQGPKGSISVVLPQKLAVKQDGSNLIVSRDGESKMIKAQHGLFRSLLANAIVGVLKGWDKRVEVVGTGYGVSLKAGDAVFKVGYSHQVTFPKTTGLTYTVEGANILVISGVDKQLVGQVAHKARSIKPPDAYKGKGVRYLGEVIKLKAGKKAKTA
jgi:large subunit ribosomal protein L6